MLRSLFLFLLSVSVVFGVSQKKVTSDMGEVYWLFDDGSWKPDSLVAQEYLAEVVTVDWAVDSTKEITIDRIEVIRAISPRLERYFGEDGAEIECMASLSNERGGIELTLEWHMPVGDGGRYFGYPKPGNKTFLVCASGQRVELSLEKKSEFKMFPQYKLTVYKNVYDLSFEVLKVLTHSAVKGVEVHWKKNPEEYVVDKPHYFVNYLPEVL